MISDFFTIPFLNNLLKDSPPLIKTIVVKMVIENLWCNHCDLQKQRSIQVRLLARRSTDQIFIFIKHSRVIQALHGTTIPAGITCEKILSERSVEFGISLKQIAAGYKQNAETFLATRSLTCRKFDSCFLFLQEYKTGMTANL